MMWGRGIPSVVLALSLAAANGLHAQPYSGPPARPSESAEAQAPERRTLRSYDYRTTETLRNREINRPISTLQEIWLDRFLANNLLRTPFLTALQDAQYNAAEILMRRGNYAGAVARLESIAAGLVEDEGEPLWVTHLNIAYLSHRRLRDLDRAEREYSLVRGNWASFAQGELARIYLEMDRPRDAVDLLLRRFEQSDEPGERLALLRRIAEIYTFANQDEEALAIYDRINREFVAEDLVAMRREAAAFVQRKVDQAIGMIERNDVIGADAAVTDILARLETLNAQGRVEEAEATAQALQVGRRRLLLAWERILLPGQVLPRTAPRSRY